MSDCRARAGSRTLVLSGRNHAARHRGNDMNGAKRLGIAAMLVLAAGLPALALADSAAASPPANGCPTGYQLLHVDTLTGEGYHVPALVDSASFKSFGQPGNGDGLVCGVPLGNQTTSFDRQVYNFIDNQLPA
jgi:hypothetical protein